MLKFQVFEVLVEAWKLRHKKEQIRLKKTRNGILRIIKFNLVSCQNDLNPPFVPVHEALKELDQKARKRAVRESPIIFAKQYCTTQ
ncbi:hypothetical protein H5410_003593 [Solanum commersonii]|uniref:Uncharacterized protein n=1 Tax=Solanum commersonii TaxID=4109 RepID=A0A9J6B5L0_SOLCO|nr:hypothetical protein H5410_003593 [Solanum commersonii]